MKHFMMTLLLLPLGSAATAQEVLFAAPGGQVVQITGTDCPDTMSCIPSATTTPDGTPLQLMVPVWATQDRFLPQDADRDVNDYLTGLSDGYIVDFCNDCKCCVISRDPLGLSLFAPWNTAPVVLQSPAMLHEQQE